MKPVLVVGAGPTGLTLACELYRRGVPCRVVDRSQARLDRVRAVDIQARTLEVLEQVGISAGILERGHKLIGMGIYESARAMARLRYYAKDAPYPFAVAVSQSVTETLLEDRLADHGGAVERGIELTGLVLGVTSATATLETPDGSVETVEVDWIVGCDGADSTVRELSEIPVEQNGGDYSFAMADAELGWALPINEMSLFLVNSGFALVVPMPDGRARVIIDNAENRPLSDLPSFAAALAVRVGAPVSLRTPGRCASYRVRGQTASVFRAGVVVLAGDAAHTFNPVGGHGMNQGIRDAYELAVQLERTMAKPANDGCILRYAEDRKKAAKTLLRSMDFEARLSITRLDVSEDDRRRLLKLLVDCAPLRRAVLDAAVDMFRPEA